MTEHGSAFWRKEKAESWFCVYRVLEFYFSFMFFFLYINIVLTWEIVGVSEALVLYILVLNLRNAWDHFTY